MMILSELTQTPATSLPLDALKDHLRLGSGFGAEGLQDSLIEAHLRAAIAAIEARIGKALLRRSFVLGLPYWRGARAQSLPLAPIGAITRVSVFDANDVETLIDPARYRLQNDLHRPQIVAIGAMLPQVPQDGRIEIAFEAGFGPNWADVPPDLAQAVMLLAAQYYEMRSPDEAPLGLPMAVQSLIQPYRNVRVLGGARS